MASTSQHNSTNQAELSIEGNNSFEEKNRFLGLFKRLGRTVSTHYSLLLASSIVVTLSIGVIYRVVKKPENELINRVARQLEPLCQKCRADTVNLICGRNIQVEVSDTQELAEIVIDCLNGSSSPLDKLSNRLVQAARGDPGQAPHTEIESYMLASVRDAVTQASGDCPRCSVKLTSPLHPRSPATIK
ncbi:MAG: hypothetical protein N2654_05295 [Deltaproteobacteria bacterium]|nr:hypothetical protein [Deltaproteobacteria bacterium]